MKPKNYYYGNFLPNGIAMSRKKTAKRQPVQNILKLSWRKVLSLQHADEDAISYHLLFFFRGVFLTHYN